MAMSNAEKNLDAASARLDAVLANPKATNKQINAALTALNKATDVFAKDVISRIDSGNNVPTVIANTNTAIDNSPVIKVDAPLGASIMAIPPAPSLPVITTPPPPPVKSATLDIILFDDETTSIDTMADLIFENIGGQELINITRSDIVNGQKISYQPIKNLSSIQQRYNPNNILSLQQTADKYFAGFSIKLEDKIPNEGNGINGENVYIEESTGDLIIEFVNINNDEQVEVQITTDGTIYEADLGEVVS